MPKRNHNELKLQMHCVRWFTFEYPKQRGCLFMVNNESRSAYEMAKLKKMGIVPGVSDLVYLAPTGRFVGIELKYGAGRQSKTQKAWQANIEKHNGHYHVINDMKDFIQIIRNYNK